MLIREANNEDYLMLKTEFDLSISFGTFLNNSFIVYELNDSFCYIKKFDSNYHIYYLLSKIKGEGNTKLLLTNIIKDLDLPITSNVKSTNIISNNLFSTLGFKALNLNNFYKNKDVKITYYYDR